MREIKFRARTRGHNGPARWVYWSVLKDCMCDIVVGHDMDKETLCEWSGREDTEGVDIYEGDEVEAAIYVDETPQNLVVEYRDTCFVIDYEDSESDCVPVGHFVGTIKVIGNIHENPELLKTGNQQA